MADNQVALEVTVFHTIPENRSSLAYLDFLDLPLPYSFLGKPIKDFLGFDILVLLLSILISTFDSYSSNLASDILEMIFGKLNCVPLKDLCSLLLKL